jgi:hypothetical protein
MGARTGHLRVPVIWTTEVWRIGAGLAAQHDFSAVGPPWDHRLAVSLPPFPGESFGDAMVPAAAVAIADERHAVRWITKAATVNEQKGTSRLNLAPQRCPQENWQPTADADSARRDVATHALRLQAAQSNADKPCMPWNNGSSVNHNRRHRQQANPRPAAAKDTRSHERGLPWPKPIFG